MFQISDHTCRSPLDCLQDIYIFIKVQCPKLDKTFQLRPPHQRAEQTNHLLCLTCHACIYQLRYLYYFPGHCTISTNPACLILHPSDLLLLSHCL